VSRIRTALGLAISVLLVLIVTLLGAFLTRDSILWPVLAARVPALLEGAVGIPVAIAAIEGDAFQRLSLRGVSVAPSTELPGLPEIEGLDVDLALDAPSLVTGNLEGLRAVRAHARRIHVVLGAGDDTPIEDDAGADPWDVADAVPTFWGLLPDGAQLEVDDMSIATRDGVVLGSGPARVRLTPRPRRRILVNWSETLSAELLLTADGLFHVEAAATDPMQRLRALGVQVPLEGGRMVVSAEGDLSARDVSGSLQWTGADLRERGASAFRAEIRLRGDFVRADARADLPGVIVSAYDLGVALSDAASALEAARGSLEVELSDLEPWRPLLPEQVLPWLPITADLRATLDGDGLDVRAGEVRARGLDVTIERGRLPLRIDGDVRNTRGSVEARISAVEAVRIDAGGTAIEFAGDCVVGVSGTLDQPAVRAGVAVRDVRAFDYAADRIDATLSLDRTSVRIDEAVVRGARPGAVATGIDAELSGTLDMGPAPLAVRTKLHASGAWPGLLAHFAPQTALFAPMLDGSDLDLDADLVFAQGTEALPVGRVGASWRGQERSPTGLDLLAQLAPAGDDVSVELALDGDASPELLAVLAAETPLATLDESVSFAVHAQGLFAEYVPRDVVVMADVLGKDPTDDAPWTVGIAATLPDANRVELHALEICGPLHASAQGTVPLTDVSDELDLALRARVDDATRLTAWIGTPLPEAELGLDGTIRGPIGRPNAEVSLELRSVDVRPLLGNPPQFDGELPAAVRARIRALDGALVLDDVGLTAGAGDEQLELDLHGRTPLRIDGGRIEVGTGLVSGTLTARSSRVANTPITVFAPIRWDERALWVPELEVWTPLSKIEGQARVADPASPLRGAPLADLGIEGSLELWQFDVTRLPDSLRPAPILAGVVDAVLSVGGTVGAPSVAGVLDLRGGRVKVANDVPTLDAIEAHLDLSPDRIEIQELTASIGSGTVEAHGAISSGDAPTLLLAGTGIQVDVGVKAREAVFLRGTGKSLRADSDIEIQGDLSRLDIEGEVVVLSGTIINRISLVPDFATRGGASVGAGFKLFEIPPPLGDALRFDVAVRTEEPLDIVTHVFNAPMSASFSLQGSGAAPFLNGAVSATRGSLRLPAMSLDVRQALITFLPDEPTRPRILVRADTRRHGVDVSLTATGPADAPEVLLSSLPPLTQQELFVLISTGVLPETLQRQGLAGRATAVGSYLAEEIINFYFGSESTEAGESLADRIHVYSGREISRKGVESIVVDVDIWKGFALEGERDIYQDFNMGVLYRVRF
jgi:hypothetical protein